MFLGGELREINSSSASRGQSLANNAGIFAAIFRKTASFGKIILATQRIEFL